MFRVGVVGVGSMGYHHARNYSELSEEKDRNIELVGIADEDFDRAREVADEYGCTPFKDYKDLVDEDLDAVSIVTPTSTHKEVALDFIRNGVNVLVEKPIADTIESGRDIIDAAEKYDVVLMTGHIERFNPPVQKLKDILEDGEIGEITSISAKRVGPLAIRDRDVGIVIDLGVHDIDVISFLLNQKIKSVYAQTGNAKHPANIEDHALITLGFNNSKTGIVETNWLTPYKTRNLEVVGTKGIANLDYQNQELQIKTKEWTKNFEIKKEEPLKKEINHFLNTIKNGENPISTGKDGLHALKVAQTAIKSSEKGKVLEVQNGSNKT